MNMKTYRPFRPLLLFQQKLVYAKTKRLIVIFCLSKYSDAMKSNASATSWVQIPWGNKRNAKAHLKWPIKQFLV